MLTYFTELVLLQMINILLKWSYENANHIKLRIMLRHIYIL